MVMKWRNKIMVSKEEMEQIEKEGSWMIKTNSNDCQHASLWYCMLLTPSKPCRYVNCPLDKEK